MTFATALTILRLLLIPVVVVAIHEGRLDLAFVAFVIAGATDAVDGYIARRFDQQTELGAYLDALADKSLIAASVLALYAVGALPYWLLVLVLFRDLLIVAAVAIAWLMHNPIAIEPIRVSKANTFAQIVLVAVLLGTGGFALALPEPVRLGLFALVAGLTVVSVTAYFARWFRHMADE